ncbi:lanC-like protein 3 homolog [Drosophila madeirensis]|uniref:LanC-like protein 3 homolog n=1 Tax=Drosophila madeirensis TaxID=30013 RepID=A0AAU9G5C9_DROMD
MEAKRYIDNPFKDYMQGEMASLQSSEQYIKGLICRHVNAILALPVSDNEYEDERENLYVGSAGIAYMFWKLHGSSKAHDLCPEALQHAATYMERAKESAQQFKRRNSERFSFLNGNAGIYAVAAAISKARGDDDELVEDLVNFRLGIAASKAKLHTTAGCDEVLEGRAGYLSGCYWLNDLLEKPVSDEELLSICATIIESGRTYGQKQGGPMPLMYSTHKTHYLGALHGLCGILHMLLDSPWFRKGSASTPPAGVASEIKKCVDYLVGLQDEEGNYPCSLESIRYGNYKTLLQWCHGAPGFAYMLAKAYLVFNENKYLMSLQRAADLIWQKGLLLKGPGLCHGIAGNGYVFLLLFRLTNEPQHLHRALKFVLMLGKPHDAQKTPDHPQSLYEGWAGAICFLIDLLEPDQAAFPFMDVFHDPAMNA